MKHQKIYMTMFLSKEIFSANCILRVGTSYEKYAKAILDYKKFVVKWLSSTWITMKMTFALFPSTLLGTLPVGLYLTMHGQLTILDVN